MHNTYEFKEVNWIDTLVSDAPREVVKAIYETLFQQSNDFCIDDITNVLLNLGYMALVPTQIFLIEREEN